MSENSKDFEGKVSSAKKLPVAAGVFNVTKDTPFEEILIMDDKGARIAFEYEGDAWKELTDAELKKLSSFTQSVYSAMRQQRATHDEDAIKRAQELVIGATRMGPAHMRARATAAPGLRAQGFRPDQIEMAAEEGWRFPKEGEIVKGAHRREGHYEMVKQSDGTLEQLWLVKDEAKFWEDENEAVKDRNRASMHHSEKVAEEVRREGFKATTA